MKRIITLLILAACAPFALAQDALKPVDYALVANIAAGRTMDFISTEKCISRPYQQCHEAELPSALVHSNLAFAVFEVGTGGISSFGEVYGVRHGHAKAARIISFAVGAGIEAVAAHNLSLARSTR